MGPSRAALGTPSRNGGPRLPGGQACRSPNNGGAALACSNARMSPIDSKNIEKTSMCKGSSTPTLKGGHKTGSRGREKTMQLGCRAHGRPGVEERAEHGVAGRPGIASHPWWRREVRKIGWQAAGGEG
ncbi:unnamed protein product [Calypogeia fissa]